MNIIYYKRDIKNGYVYLNFFIYDTAYNYKRDIKNGYVYPVKISWTLSMIMIYTGNFGKWLLVAYIRGRKTKRKLFLCAFDAVKLMMHHRN